MNLLATQRTTIFSKATITRIYKILSPVTLHTLFVTYQVRLLQQKQPLLNANSYYTYTQSMKLELSTANKSLSTLSTSHRRTHRTDISIKHSTALFTTLNQFIHQQNKAARLYKTDTRFLNNRQRFTTYTQSLKCNMEKFFNRLKNSNQLTIIQLTL